MPMKKITKISAYADYFIQQYRPMVCKKGKTLMKKMDPMEKTKQVVQKTQAFNDCVLKKSKKISHPSKEVMEKGNHIGDIIAGGLIVVGGVQLCFGFPYYALGSSGIGIATLISHRICKNLNH